MPISFVGKYPEHTRIITGNTSLDIAVSGINFKREVLPGLPMRCGYHIWSKATGIGKTHLALSLTGKIAAHLGKNVAITPIDTFDIGNMQSILEHSGMNTSVEIVLSDKGDAKSLDDLNTTLAKRGICVSLLDSAYSAMSTAVDEGDVEDANMGRDAKMISTYARQAKGTIDMAKEDKVFIVTNMSFVNINARRGFGPPPYEPARGRTLMGMTSIHIDLSDGWISNKSMKFDKGKLLTGKVLKNNFGPTDRTFNVFMIGGLGIHDGLTDVFDCVQYGLAELKGSSSKTAKVILDGKTYPLADMLQYYETREIFEPFHSAIVDNYSSILNNELNTKNLKKLIDDEEDVVEEDEINNRGQTPEELNA